MEMGSRVERGVRRRVVVQKQHCPLSACCWGPHTWAFPMDLFTEAPQNVGVGVAVDRFPGEFMVEAS